MPVSRFSNGATAKPLMAAGQPISEAVADQAAGWLTLLMSTEATRRDQQRWQQWRAAHPDHDRAWTHIEAVTQRFKMLEPRAGYQTLSPYAGAVASGRRKALNLLLWGSVAGATGLLASRTQTWQQQMADYRTGTGEQRTVTLADGSRILLNTASAVNVRFDGEQRLVRLVAGEVLIVTSHALGADATPDGRPFVVQTGQGSIRALGTRFSVRQQGEQTRVAVQEHAVEITLAEDGQAQVLQAGQQTSFSRASIGRPLPVPEGDGSWARGQIVANDMPLGDFLAELGRYRPGLVRCDPAIAGLRFSGVFPLQDTDRILSTLPRVLPVQVRLRTRYWVTVEAAA